MDKQVDDILSYVEPGGLYQEKGADQKTYHVSTMSKAILDTKKGPSTDEALSVQKRERR